MEGFFSCNSYADDGNWRTHAIHAKGANIAFCIPPTELLPPPPPLLLFAFNNGLRRFEKSCFGCSARARTQSGTAHVAQPASPARTPAGLQCVPWYAWQTKSMAIARKAGLAGRRSCVCVCSDSWEIERPFPWAIEKKYGVPVDISVFLTLHPTGSRRVLCENAIHRQIESDILTKQPWFFKRSFFWDCWDVGDTKFFATLELGSMVPSEVRTSSKCRCMSLLRSETVLSTSLRCPREETLKCPKFE